jgi:hypothetical protein
MPLGVEKRERSLLGQLKQRERMPYIHWFRTGRRIQPPQPLKRSSLDELDTKQSTTLTTAMEPGRKEGGHRQRVKHQLQLKKL